MFIVENRFDDNRGFKINKYNMSIGKSSEI